MRMHNGVDLQCPEGTPVYATADGVVSFSGEQRGYGNIIIVEHANELASVYAHLKKRRADRGEGVRQGQHIGDVGKTGNATTHHLHYEIRHRGEPVDAMAYLPK
jgi:murein DD-endopeptidase MepM/ murein hydrolase activator NlpD